VRSRDRDGRAGEASKWQGDHLERNVMGLKGAGLYKVTIRVKYNMVLSHDTIKRDFGVSDGWSQ
jgi:hypothetical protein